MIFDSKKRLVSVEPKSMQRLTQPSGESLFRRFGFAAEKRGKPGLSAIQPLEPLGPSFAKGFHLHQDYGGQAPVPDL